MNAHASAGASAPEMLRLPGSLLRPAGRRLGDRAIDLVRSTGAAVKAGVDGLLLGLVVAYVVAVLISGPAKFLGLPWPLESLLTGAGALAIATLGATGGLIVHWILLRVATGVRRGVERWRPTGRVRRVAGLPVALTRGLPAGRLGAFAALLLLANVGEAVGPFGLFIPAGALGPYVLLTGAVFGLGFSAWHVARGRPLQSRARTLRPSPAGPHRTAAALLAGAAVVIAGGGVSVILDAGSPSALVATRPDLDGVGAPVLSLDDPGAPGPYAVRSLSYGSGTDRHRPAFGAAVTVTTPSVDASAVLQRLGGGADEARELFWGFGLDRLPLNGLVWLPEGDGPFPLVLMVHGNHAMGDFSEPGYAYLGEHLASRGFLAVSVDENFLNGSWADDWGGAEQLARAWFLLLHLDQWRTWTADPESPFHGLVDLDRVALIGHSRGGEAASVAATLAGQSSGPVPGIRWPTGLQIRAVIAIAPSDGQYGPSSVVLDGADYLTIHGGHDGDATSWMGIRQYGRTRPGEGGFKAALWSYRSNHGQFNSVWGRSDQGPLGGAILNLAPILAPEDQRDVARTSIGAFLEASLHDQLGYRALFHRPMAGRSWLPVDDIFMVRSSDDAFVPLTTTDAAGGRDGTVVTSTGFASQRSVFMPLRDLLPDQGTRALELRWVSGSAEAAWEVGGVGSIAGKLEPVAIRFSLANGALAPAGDSATPSRALDVQVAVVTSDGVTATLPLSRWGALPPPLEVRLVKNHLFAALSGMDVAQGAPVERVLQTYEVPLAEFVNVDPAFDPAELAAIRFVVDRSSPGALWVTEVGLVAGR